jgi:hypothetical protein
VISTALHLNGDVCSLQVVVNTTLDIYLITQLGMGVVGAAWATVVAQYLGMLLLLARLRSGPVAFRFGKAFWQRLGDLWRTLAPLVVVYVSRNLCYMRLQVCWEALLLPCMLVQPFQARSPSCFAATAVQKPQVAGQPCEPSPCTECLMSLASRVSAY